MYKIYWGNNFVQLTQKQKRLTEKINTRIFQIPKISPKYKFNKNARKDFKVSR